MIFNIIKNIRLLYSLEKKYNCKTGIKIFAQRFSRGTAFKFHDGRHKACVRWDILASPMFYQILLHEIGHCVEPNGFHSNNIIAELAAWNFVLREKQNFTPQEIGELMGAFSSYLTILSMEDRAYYLNTLIQLINFHLFGVEE